VVAEHFQHKPNYTEDTMNTTEQQRRKKAPIVAAAALAAAAITISALGQTAPANANADHYVALAYSFQSDVAGIANNFTDGGDPVRFAALKNCQDDNGGNHCQWFGTFRNECAALAVLGARDWATGTGPNLATAKQNALASNPGGRIAVSGCAHSLRKDGDSFPVPTHTMVPSAPQ
jgi:hypothetical protein